MATALTPDRAWARLASDDQVTRTAAALEANGMRAIVVDTADHGGHRRRAFRRRGDTPGDLLGIAPTGRRLRWDTIDIYRLANGMIVEEWAADDSTAILHHVGAYTPRWLGGSQS